MVVYACTYMFENSVFQYNIIMQIRQYWLWQELPFSERPGCTYSLQTQEIHQFYYQIVLFADPTHFLPVPFSSWCTSSPCMLVHLLITIKFVHVQLNEFLVCFYHQSSLQSVLCQYVSYIVSQLFFTNKVEYYCFTQWFLACSTEANCS